MRQAIALFATLISVVAPRRTEDPVRSAEHSVSNDNRRPAGTLRDGVLMVHLEVREVDWRPDGDAAPGIVLRAFAERGERASIPGPLLRVPEGATIDASVSNPLSRGTLVVRGLSTRG